MIWQKRIAHVLFVILLGALSTIASSMSFVRQSLPDIIRHSECAMHGVIQELKAEPIPSEKLNVQSKLFGKPNKNLRNLIIRMRVMHSAPALSDSLITVIFWGEPKFYPVGLETIDFLRKQGDHYIPYNQYARYPQDFRLMGSIDRSRTSLDRAWNHVQTMRDEVMGTPMNKAVVREKTEIVRTGSLAEACFAYELLLVKHKDALTTDVLIDALENQYAHLISAVPLKLDHNQRSYQLSDPNHDMFRELATHIVDDLLPVANDSLVARAKALYTIDQSDPRKFFFDNILNDKMLRLISQTHEPKQVRTPGTQPISKNGDRP